MSVITLTSVWQHDGGFVNTIPLNPSLPLSFAMQFRHSVTRHQNMSRDCSRTECIDGLPASAATNSSC